MKKQKTSNEILNLGLLKTLCSFIKKNNAEVVELFLSKNKEEITPYINLIVSYKSGMNCFHLAVSENNPEIIKQLFDFPNLDVNCEFYREAIAQTALHLIAGNAEHNKDKDVEEKNIDEKESVLDLLLSHKSIALNTQTSEGETPLHRAAGNGFSFIVFALLKKNADPNLLDTSGRNPLHYAAAGGHTAVVEMLLQHGVDAEKLDSEGNNPLFYAAKNNHIEIIKLLLQQGVSLSFDNKNLFKMILQNAIDEQNWDVVALLLEHGVGIGQRLFIPNEFFESFNALQYPFVFGMEINGVPVSKDTPNFGLAITDFESLLGYEKQLKVIRKILKNISFESLSYEEQLKKIEKIVQNNQEGDLIGFNFQDALEILGHRLRCFNHDKAVEKSSSIREIKKLFYQVSQEEDDGLKNKIKEEFLEKLINLAKQENSISDGIFSVPYQTLLSLFKDAFGFMTSNKKIEKVREYLLIQGGKEVLQTLCFRSLLNNYPMYQEKENKLLLIPNDTETLPVQTIIRYEEKDKVEENKEKGNEEKENEKKKNIDFPYDAIKTLWSKNKNSEVYLVLDETKEFLEKFLKEVGEISLVNEEIVPYGMSWTMYSFVCVLPCLLITFFFIKLGNNTDSDRKVEKRIFDTFLSLLGGGVLAAMSLMIYVVLAICLKGIGFPFLWDMVKISSRPSYRISAETIPGRVLTFSSELQKRYQNIVEMVTRLLKQFQVLIDSNNIKGANLICLKKIEKELQEILEDLQRAKTYEMYEGSIQRLINHVDKAMEKIKQTFNEYDDASLFLLLSPYKYMYVSQKSENDDVGKVERRDVIIDMGQLAAFSEEQGMTDMTDMLEMKSLSSKNNKTGKNNENSKDEMSGDEFNQSSSDEEKPFIKKPKQNPKIKGNRYIEDRFSVHRPSSSNPPRGMELDSDSDLEGDVRDLVF